MRDIPKMHFADALAEIWSQINFAAYHMAYVQVYTQSEALRNRAEALRDEERSVRDHVQVDIIIWSTHLAAFFWHLEHVFEALRTAIMRKGSSGGDVSTALSSKLIITKLRHYAGFCRAT
jgi:hypothetical protein